MITVASFREYDFFFLFQAMSKLVKPHLLMIKITLLFKLENMKSI